MNKYISLTLLVLLLFLMSCSKVNEKMNESEFKVSSLQVSPLFSSNMVLQRDKIISIWGKGDAASEVRIKFINDDKTVQCDSEGNWFATLSKYPAGGPEILRISDDIGGNIILKNILLGDVWICSGQSNMEMPLVGDWGRVLDYETEIKNADYEKIRLFTVEKRIAFKPVEELSAGIWELCTPENTKDFSATAYFFARKIYKETGIPIGLVHSSWGGTVAEAWTDRAFLSEFNSFKDELENQKTQIGDREQRLTSYQKDLENWYQLVAEKDLGHENTVPIWAKNDLDDSQWEKMDIPDIWENQGLPDFDGVVWFRKHFNISDDFELDSLICHLGSVDDEDITWINGNMIGQQIIWNEPRNYEIPREFIRKGENILTVRVHDNVGAGGIWGNGEDINIDNKPGQKILLNGKWKYRIGADLKDLPGAPRHPDDPNQLSVLYNAMIYPLRHLSIRGIIWYQGESNADRGLQYQKLFPSLIHNWRQLWEDETLPFYFVQLANFMERNTEPVDDDWATLREAQFLTLKKNNTGMAVAIDIGDAKDIHPANKQEVGRRLALWALRDVYKQELTVSGPLYSHHKIEGQAIRIYFDYADMLQTSYGKALKGFAIAGKNQRFVWAETRIEDNTVLVFHKDIINPQAVRYAWSSNPECNLINESRLPGSPFRTDNWKSSFKE